MKRLLLICLLPSLFASCASFKSSAKPRTNPDQPKVIAVSEYGARIIGKWQSSNSSLVFYKNGTWDRMNYSATVPFSGKRNWDLNANRLTLSFDGPNGVQSAEYRVADFTENSFTMSTDNVGETYTRVK